MLSATPGELLLLTWRDTSRAARRMVPRHDPVLARVNPLFAAWLVYEPFMGYRAMRLPVLVSIHHHRLRRKLVARYAHAVPSAEALALVASYSPLVEMGAGTGYWAHLLHRDYGADIVAYDSHPPREGENNWCQRREYVPIRRGTPADLAAHPDRTLLLVWPPMSDMADACLQAYRGTHVILIGEPDGGCTGDQALFDRLTAEWDAIADLELPQWDGMHDALVVYRRKA